MTHVSLCRYRDAYIFQCTGHAGYAQSGEDILCSAVSVLCYTLDEYLKRAHGEGRLLRYISSFASADVTIEFEPRNSDRVLLEAVNAVLGGFALLAENYGDYILADIQPIR